MDKQYRFLIVTTGNLPEAYFLADHLLRSDQEVGVVDFSGRSMKSNLAILRRLRQRRGIRFAIDFLLGKLLLRFFNRPDVVPFPEIDDAKISSLISQCEYFTTSNLHDSATLEFVKVFQPDYILIAGAPVIRKELYEQAAIATLNRHLGMAPDYRGSDCPVWAMSNDDFSMVGFTIHELTDVVDGGMILLQRAVEIPQDYDLSHALSFVSRKGSEGFLEVIDQFVNGNPCDQIRQRSGGHHFPPASLSALISARRNLSNRS